MFHVRAATPADHPDLVSLWRESSGWDDVTEEEWNDRMFSSPAGPAIIVVSEDDASGAIVGQLAFIPVEVTLRGRLVRAARAFAPILHESARQPLSAEGSVHPVVAMVLQGVQELQTAGVEILYMMPDPRWARLLRGFASMKTATFPLWTRRLTGSTPGALGKDLRIEECRWESDLEDLCLQHGLVTVCSPARSVENVRWKARLRGLDTWQVSRDNLIVGVFGGKKHGHQQWVIGDLILRDFHESLEATLEAAVQTVRARATPDLDRISVLGTPAMESALREARFQPEGYEFLLAVQGLSSTIEPRDIDPAVWQISALD